jgi:hypothetical protein
MDDEMAAFKAIAENAFGDPNIVLKQPTVRELMIKFNKIEKSFGRKGVDVPGDPATGMDAQVARAVEAGVQDKIRQGMVDGGASAQELSAWDARVSQLLLAKKQKAAQAKVDARNKARKAKPKPGPGERKPIVGTTPDVQNTEVF